MTPLLKKILGMNLGLVVVMYGLLIFGIFSIESAARHLTEGGEYYANRQKMYVVLGSVVYFAVALTDYRWVRWLALPMYLASLGFQVMLMLGIWKAPGDDVHQLVVPGTGLAFQPTTLVVASGIILIGMSFDLLPRLHRIFKEPMVKILLVGLLTGIPFILVIINGDMGSALVFLPVAFIALLVGGVPFWHLCAMLLFGAGLLPPLYYLVLPSVSERGTERIEQYLGYAKTRRVEKDDGDNWAPYWVSTAIGQAGFKGLGYKAKESQGSILDGRVYIPRRTAHNDYIFAVIAEEQGFRGALLMLTSFALLLIQVLFVAFYSRDFLGQVAAAGVVAMFFAHIFESVGMCVLLTPITGIPLPLISYSGTFVLICMFLLGLVQSVWVHRNELHGVVDGRQ
ncbi:MAG: FtsW/RodA/SpoVE family cell cycle protein [Verrucomicrobiota bacterium JB023]|nr:FtsW/RodA/SpoVE family cell cycle protein [Verrucomicrobiota bacterium JB023]